LPGFRPSRHRVLPRHECAGALHQLLCVPVEPPDFHACFEVFVDGWWYAFDATHLAPLNGLIRIATGRDAADTAVCTIFGNPELTLSAVWCISTDASFIPITRDDLARRNEAIVLL